MAIDFNTSPYYDDYLSNNGGLSKNYYKVLFRPGRALQARELTTAQTILQNQVGSFGRRFFPDGASIYGSEKYLHTNLDYVILSPTLSDGTTPIAKTASADEFLNFSVGDIIIGATSGITASIQFVSTSEFASDPNMIFVKYLSSDIGSEAETFAPNEVLYLAADTSTEIAYTSNSELGHAHAVSIGEGIIFTKDIFVQTIAQNIVVKKTTIYSNSRIGYVVTNKIITSTDDISLKDNSQGYPNYSADGADREKVNLVLCSIGYDTDWVANEVPAWNPNLQYNKNAKVKITGTSEVFICITPHTSSILNQPITGTDSAYWVQAINFIEIARLKDGQWYAAKDAPPDKEVGFSKSTFDTILSLIEKRTYDINGDFTIKPFGLHISDLTKDINPLMADSRLMLLSIDYGHAYKSGKEIIVQKPEWIITEKTRTPRHIKSVTNFSPEVNYGNYMLTENLNGYFDFSTHETVTLYNENTSTLDWNTANNEIGTAKIRYFNLHSGRYAETSNTESELYPAYRAYLYDLVFTKTGEIRAIEGAHGRADTKQTKIQVTAAANTGDINIYTANTYGVLYETGAANKAIFDFRPGYVCRVASNNTEGTPVYYTQKDFPAQLVLNTVEGRYELRSPTSNTFFVESEFGSEVGNGLTNPSNEVDIAEANYILYNMSGDIIDMTSCESDIQIENGMPIPLDAICGETGSDFKWTSGSPKQFSVYFPTSNVSATLIPDIVLRINLGISEADADTKIYRPCQIKSVLSLSSATTQGYDSPSISFFESDIFRLDAVYMAATGNTSPSLPTIEISQTMEYFVTRNGENVYEIDINGVRTGATGRLISNIYDDVWTFLPKIGTFTVGNFLIGEKYEGKAEVVSAPVLNAAAIDITDRYILDTGQRDNYYDWSKLVLKTGKTPPTDPIIIVYDKFDIEYGNDLEKSFFSLSSYGTMYDTGFSCHTANTIFDEELTYSELPIYNSNKLGDLRLRDCIDFRVVRSTANTMILSNSNDLSTGISSYISDRKDFWFEDTVTIANPSPMMEDLFTLDYDHYMHRVGSVILDNDYKFKFIDSPPGVSDYPPVPENSMTLWNLFIPPYLDNLTDIQKTHFSHRLYKMRDIGDLDKRLTTLERTVKLNAEELRAISQPEPSISELYIGLERFKNGIILDTFDGHSVGNVYDDEYRCSIDKNQGILRSPFESNTIEINEIISYSDVEYHVGDSTSYVDSDAIEVTNHNGILTLSYTNDSYVEQLDFTDSISVTPFVASLFAGKITLDPSADNWYDTTRLPDVEINMGGEADAWEHLSSSVNERLYVNVGATVLFKIGSQVTTNSGGSGMVSELDGQNVILTNFGGTFGIDDTIKGKKEDGSIVTYVIKETFVRGGVEGFGTEFNDWQTTWTGKSTTSTTTTYDESTKKYSSARTTTTPTIQTATVNTSSLSTSLLTQNLGDKIVDVAIIPYIREKDVLFIASGLKPNTVHYAFFNGVDVSMYCANRTLSGGMWYMGTAGESLVSDANGRIHGVFKLPGGVFSTGERTFRLTSNRINYLPNTYSFAETKYLASGLQQTVVDQIVSTRVPIIEKRDLTVERSVTTSAPAPESTYVYYEPANTGAYTAQPLPSNPSKPDQYFANVDGDKAFQSYSSYAAQVGVPTTTMAAVADAYKTVLDRYPEQSGATYWANLVNTGALSLDNLQSAIVAGAKGTDIPYAQDVMTSSTLRAACTTTTDPLAQSFFVDKDINKDGIFLTSIDVFVANIPTSMPLPLMFELRTLINGYPSQYIIPGSAIVYNYLDEISFSSHDGSNTLTIDTIYNHNLLDGQYVTITGDVNYNGVYPVIVMSATQFKVTVNFIDVGSAQPDDISFSKINVATEDNNWIPTKFVFDYPIYLSDGEYCFVLKSDVSDYEVFVSHIGQYSLKSGNLISKQPYLGSLFKSQNASTWTASQEGDIAFKIWKAKFDINVTGDIEFTQNDYSLNFFNGVVREFSDKFNLRYQLLNFQSGSLVLNNTSIKWYYKGTGTNGVLDSAWKYLAPDSNTELPEPNLIIKDGQSIRVRAQMYTDNPDISPVIDLQKQKAIIVENIINNSNAGEYMSVGGAAQSKYISRSVVLEEGMDAIDCKVYFECARTRYNGSTAEVKVYVKLLSAEDESVFEDRFWYPMIKITDPGYSSSKSDFKKYGYKLPRNIWFVDEGFGQISVHYTGDGVLYNNAPLNYDASQIELFMEAGTVPLEHLHYDEESESMTYTYYDGNAYPSQSEIKSYNSFKQYATKLVMITSNSAQIPLIKNLKALALT